MSMKVEQLLLWIEKGFQCLNCGEHVPNSCKTFNSLSEIKEVEAIIFEGICKSDLCRQLPPGGNPFQVIIS